MSLFPGNVHQFTHRSMSFYSLPSHFRRTNTMKQASQQTVNCVCISLNNDIYERIPIKANSGERLIAPKIKDGSAREKFERRSHSRASLKNRAALVLPLTILKNER